ncbi:26.2 kDa heat shock protein, mitochondrial-like [Panicum virgatum]|uniref:26.2 kDa heat shock protein, mitochondrial-like n=1 Tax=Panicum virgatum TaxID=38727 RepID=UPI0019D66EFF|nr:26.2 kDa heat shock protein, mitochondrial-like [Panicum virgatum]
MPDAAKRNRVAAILIYTAWNIWNERNRRIFQGVVQAPQRILGLIKEEMALRQQASFGVPIALRPASVAAARRLFNTGGARFRRDDDDDYEESSGDEDVRAAPPVKVWADQDALVIAGEDTGDDDEEGPARYGGCIALSWDAFKMDRIKAEMKDGVLKVNLPKIKVEDRKDVFQVKVE